MDDAKKRKVLFYARQGYSASELVSVLKVSRQRASQLLHEAGIKPRSSPPLLMRHEVASYKGL